MMTQEPQVPDVEYQPRGNMVYQERQYKLITPLYGGGVDPNKSDPISIVRGTEVRGHLRFWWRATQLGRFSTVEELFSMESKIWGSSKIPSSVQLIISEATFDENGSKPAYKVKNREGRNTVETSKDIAPYVSFPLQPDKNQRWKLGWESEKVLMDVRFTLILKFPEKFQKEIDQSLWAWENFGGIGARTRRGFGSIVCLTKDGVGYPQPEISKLEGDIKEFLDKLNLPNPAIPGIPYLSPKSHFKVVTHNASPHVHWKQLIEKYQEFRQSRLTPRGRSLWPAPDVIRRKTGDYDPQHKPQHQVQDKIPRAQFGLPIIFKFSPNNPNDPQPTTLQGKNGIDRMSSPLILRSIQCDNEVGAGLALILDWESVGQERYTPPDGLELIGYPDPIDVYSNLDSIEAASIVPLKGEVNPLLAFLNFL